MKKVLGKLLKSLQHYFFSSRDITFSLKGKGNYVSNMDCLLEEIIKCYLKKRYPKIGFLGEEGEAIDTSEDCFILDPIDGTTNFIRQHHMSAISLALRKNGEITLGLIYDPYFDELFVAEKGKGCYLNDELVRPLDQGDIATALIAIGTTPYDKDIGQKMFPILQNVLPDCLDIRRSGSAALDLAYVACGRLDGFVEADLRIWDYAAGVLMVQEAGGTVEKFVLSRGNNAGNIIAGKNNVTKYLQKRVAERN